MFRFFFQLDRIFNFPFSLSPRFRQKFAFQILLIALHLFTFKFLPSSCLHKMKWNGYSIKKLKIHFVSIRGKIIFQIKKKKEGRKKEKCNPRVHLSGERETDRRIVGARASGIKRFMVVSGALSLGPTYHATSLPSPSPRSLSPSSFSTPSPFSLPSTEPSWVDWVISRLK